MKIHRFTVLFASIFILTSGCDQIQPPREAATNSASMAQDIAVPVSQGAVIATVNGAPITQSVFDVYATQRSSKQPDETGSNREALLEELISLELMRQESMTKGINTQTDVIATLEQQNRTVLAGAAIKDFVRSNPVSDDELKRVYDEQIGTPKTEYNARHILLETKDEAIAVIAELDDGADFAELAKEKSTGPSGAAGGELGWFSPAQMVQPFSEAAAKLEKDSYTKEPVQTQFGWHVILLEDSRESSPPSFESVKDRLHAHVANRKLQEHIRSIRTAAEIDIKSE